MSNLILLCARHHTAVHEGGWALARAPDGTITATPPWETPPTDRDRDVGLVA